jgi:hypothetical protein
MNENQAERAVFSYNLSAFLTAFRSVPEIMKKEFKKISGFIDWYHVQVDNLKTDKKMNLLHTKRNINIHQNNLQLHAQVNVSITEHLHATDSSYAIVIHVDGTREQPDSKPQEPPELPEAPSNSPKTEISAQWQWYFDEIPDIDVVTICNECMTIMETMVSECDQRFGLS